MGHRADLDRAGRIRMLENIDLGSERRRRVLFRSRHTGQPRRALTDLVLTGMHRELCEESLVRPEEIIADSAVVTGYFRWVDRAMKPEFSGLVRLDSGIVQLHRLPGRR